MYVFWFSNCSKKSELDRFPLKCELNCLYSPYIALCLHSRVWGAMEYISPKMGDSRSERSLGLHTHELFVCVCVCVFYMLSNCKLNLFICCGDWQRPHVHFQKYVTWRHLMIIIKTRSHYAVKTCHYWCWPLSSTVLHFWINHIIGSIHGPSNTLMMNKSG